MKKYYQALLVVTAVVSLVSLLIYRHEYNKLRYVLEVFSYFGSRTADTNCTNFSSTFVTNQPLNQRFDEPIPSWQRLEDDLYIYSVYNIKYQTYKEIRAIGIGTVNSVSNVQCLVFFESESKPALGSFKFMPIGRFILDVQGSKYRGYNFICTYTSDETPTGITFVTKSNKYLDYAPIFPIKTLPQTMSVNGIGICVLQSSTKPMRSVDMTSFISFHTLIGMDNFIVYDSGVPSEINVKLKELAKDLNSSPRFTYTVVPWNFPFVELDQNVVREIAETDCLYRTYNGIAYIVVLSWNEYVIPRYHRATIDLMMDIKLTEFSAERYKLRTTTFCTQQADNKQYVNSTLTILKKTRPSTKIENHPVYIYQPRRILQAELQNSQIRTKEIGKGLLTVNQYKYCDSNKENQEMEDSTILRFAEDVQNSWILKRYHELLNRK